MVHFVDQYVAKIFYFSPTVVTTEPHYPERSLDKERFYVEGMDIFGCAPDLGSVVQITAVSILGPLE